MHETSPMNCMQQSTYLMHYFFQTFPWDAFLKGQANYSEKCENLLTLLMYLFLKVLFKLLHPFKVKNSYQ
jgi:hypothetical protein